MLRNFVNQIHIVRSYKLMFASNVDFTLSVSVLYYSSHCPAWRVNVSKPHSLEFDTITGVTDLAIKWVRLTQNGIISWLLARRVMQTHFKKTHIFTPIWTNLSHSMAKYVTHTQERGSLTFITAQLIPQSERFLVHQKMALQNRKWD